MKRFGRVLAIVVALSLCLASCGGGGQQSGGGASSKPSQSQPSGGGSAAPSGGSDWQPGHEMRLIVPYKEGGASHKAALLIKNAADEMGSLDEPFVVVCMPNAATLEGQEEVLNAKPDGHTLLVHHNAMVNGYALGKQDYTYDDFTMICQLYETPLAIAVRADSPWNTLEEMVAGIKAEPGKYSWTWAGTGGNTHFASYVFYDAAGINGTSDVIPAITKGDGESVVNLVGGTADICIAQTNAFPEFVKSGEVKVLGHSGAGSIDIGGQEVPSWTDAGFDATYNLRCFLFGPKDLEAGAYAKLSEIAKAIVESDTFADAMLADGFTPTYLNAEDSIEAFKVEADTAIKIAEIINAAG